MIESFLRLYVNNAINFAKNANYIELNINGMLNEHWGGGALLSKISKKMSSHFIKRGDILEEEREVYDYYFEIMLSTVLNALFLIVCGIVLNNFINTILFMIGFVIFRTVSGGFHASSHMKCFLTLVSVFFLLIIMLKFIPMQWMNILTIIWLLISTLLIYFIAPVEHKDNPLDDKTREKLKKCAQILSVLISLIIIVLIFTIGFSKYIFSFCYGMFAVAISIAVVKINEIIMRG